MSKNQDRPSCIRILLACQLLELLSQSGEIGFVSCIVVCR